MLVVVHFEVNAVDPEVTRADGVLEEVKALMAPPRRRLKSSLPLIAGRGVASTGKAAGVFEKSGGLLSEDLVALVVGLLDRGAPGHRT